MQQSSATGGSWGRSADVIADSLPRSGRYVRNAIRRTGGQAAEAAVGAGVKHRLAPSTGSPPTLIHLRHGATYKVPARWLGVDRSTKPVTPAWSISSPPASTCRYSPMPAIRASAPRPAASHHTATQRRGKHLEHLQCLMAHHEAPGSPTHQPGSRSNTASPTSRPASPSHATTADAKPCRHHPSSHRPPHRPAGDSPLHRPTRQSMTNQSIHCCTRPRSNRARGRQRAVSPGTCSARSPSGKSCIALQGLRRVPASMRSARFLTAW